ncbi:type I restriction enzyme, S subunit [Arachidicoccus rhizosphaerae]|uniref:Type I restriction enzyme, S subunit n=1 Tax=Arachidicoccus rhizosphaerae TaxID=551991 RepID=A0A1H3YU31_9BACT|nr:restriction endonuclease subunit S [Arachidicoccus rhizosphaerae]SEA14552.1 type I restriction enzyme, S subunit [Arachidicoccus rhizosphaerae]
MSEWKEYKLKDLGILQRGRSRHRPRYAFHLYGGKYPFIQTGEIREASKYIRHYQQTYSEEGLKQSKLWPKGTLCITIAANIAELAILDFDACFPDSVLGFIPDKSIVDLDFVYYTLNHFQKELKYIGEGSVQDNINLGTFENILYPIPSLREQIAIASILSSLDDKIDLLQCQNETLEKMAETLFRQWFVEEAKEEWENETLGKWAIDTLGGEWGKENAVGEFNKPVYCIRGTDIADLNNGLPERTPIRFVKEKKFLNIEPREGDLIIEISGGTENQSTGRVCYINKDIKGLFDKPLIFSNFCRLIRIKKEEYSFFLYCYIQYLYNQDEFFNLENGSSGIKNLNYKALLNDLEYLMPDEKTVMEFQKKVKHLFEKINRNKYQIRILMKLRDTLLPKLMNGEVKVKEQGNK